MKDDKVKNSKVTTTPPKKQRSQKQMEWSRQLGKNSQEYKRKKRERLTQTFSKPSETENNVVEEPKYSNTSEAGSEAHDNKVTDNKVELNIWYIIVPLSLLIGGGLIAAKLGITKLTWDKYRQSRDQQSCKDSNKPNCQVDNSAKDKIIKSSIVEME
ncbi:MAG: hypothetical protein MJA29_07740 [Candidatus Omnitrophica bacterium]|nr:hypothetical protein [Candidatus Omnitrophota bacterium]